MQESEALVRVRTALALGKIAGDHAERGVGSTQSDKYFCEYYYNIICSVIPGLTRNLVYLLDSRFRGHDNLSAFIYVASVERFCQKV
jgi:hypothetical protein